jgi:hypothetical protein
MGERHRDSAASWSDVVITTPDHRPRPSRPVESFRNRSANEKSGNGSRISQLILWS